MGGSCNINDIPLMPPAPMFPYPLEATGGLTLIYFTIFYLTIGKFPFPHEVNGGSNLIGIMTITTLGFGFRSLSG